MALAMSAALLAACAAPAASPTAATAVPARPSNPGGPGAAITLTGDAKAGAVLFATNCKVCHGETGTGGVSNPGSSDGTVPTLNPIDDTLKNANPVLFATNLDLFIEHGSTPAGDQPQRSMPAWGDQKLLNSQQIADVIAYVISLNTH